MKGRLLLFVALVAFGWEHPARAGDGTARPLDGQDASLLRDWSGLYVGTHGGYATGRSKWSATEANGLSPSLSGALDFFNSCDSFNGSGSYFLGLQAGYDHMLPSRLLLGIEADVSFPSLIGGTQMMTTPLTGGSSYTELMQYSGSVRGRIGYAPGNWLFYATGGFAWTADQFTRSQLTGMPVGGVAGPGDVESRYLLPRIGAAAGAGVEVMLPSNWSARFEYLFADYRSVSVNFPDGAQQFNSNLATQSVRLGLNYRPGAAALTPDFFVKQLPAPNTDWFNLHGQTTYLQQYVFPFHAPYKGPNSLDSNIGRETWDATFYAGFRLWQGAELWVNPEIDQGFGLSGTFGVAGFTSGEAYKVGSSVPYARVPRMFVRQTIDLGGDAQKLEAGINQFAGTQTADRLVITVGKFSVVDVFDINRYAHDPRSDFMNWAIADTGAFDYAADAWGYTWGGAVEWYRGDWALRGGAFDFPVTPNNSELDPTFHQFQLAGEVEHRHELAGQPGKIAISATLGRARLGRFADAVELAQLTGGIPNTADVRQYRSRETVSFNLEQQLTPDLGLFVRAGWASGDVEPVAFTDIDRTIATGIVLNGKPWGQPDHTFGLAGIVNGISAAHQAYFDAGGLGIVVGDGSLPHYGPEQIIETYYSLPLFSWRVTFDYQYIVNPGYNRDRGPASVIGTRLHAQF